MRRVTLIASELKRLMYSPFWVAKLLHHFLSGVTSEDERGIKIELIYFVIPFIFDANIRNKLVKANKNSTMATLFNDIELKNHLILKAREINEFRKITNEGFIVLGNKTQLEISDYIFTRNIIEYQKEKNILIRDYCRTAYYLGVVFSKENYKNIFLKVGVSKI